MKRKMGIMITATRSKKSEEIAAMATNKICSHISIDKTTTNNKIQDSFNNSSKQELVTTINNKLVG